MNIWTVYILECADKTLYTGITNHLKNRLEKHSNGTGAKYTKGRAPFKVVYTEQHHSKSQALKREIWIKSLRRAEKLALLPPPQKRRNRRNVNQLMIAVQK